MLKLLVWSMLAAVILSAGVTSITPTDFCTEIARSGSYKPIEETDCKRFIVCYATNDAWHGVNLNCPDNQYFDEEKVICSNKKPDNCN